MVAKDRTLGGFAGHKSGAELDRKKKMLMDEGVYFDGYKVSEQSIFLPPLDEEVCKEKKDVDNKNHNIPKTNERKRKIDDKIKTKKNTSNKKHKKIIDLTNNSSDDDKK